MCSTCPPSLLFTFPTSSNYHYVHHFETNSITIINNNVTPAMDTTKSYFQKNSGRSTSKVLAVLTLFPISGFFLILAALIFTATLIGLTIATPIFVLFSPVLVPALLTIGFAVTGFIASGAFGISALSSLTHIVNYFNRMRSRDTGGVLSVQQQLDYAKRRAQDTAGYVGQKVKDVGQRTQDSVRASGSNNWAS